MCSVMNLSLQKLEEAISLRRQIATMESRLAAIFQTGGSTSAVSARTPTRRKRRSGMTPAVRAKIAAAARARWAVRKGQSPAAAAKPAAKPAAAPKKKGGLTAAGRKKLSMAMKARGAARKKAAGAAK